MGKRNRMRQSIQDSLADVMANHVPLTPQAILDRPNMTNADKRAWCIARAEEARRRYAQGQHETIVDVLLNDTGQFEQLDGPARVKVAKLRWSSNTVAKQLAAEDSMYTTWAGLYA